MTTDPSKDISKTVLKAAADDFTRRFREVIADHFDPFDRPRARRAQSGLQRGGVSRVFLFSTHAQELHLQVIDQLASLGYRIEVSADYSAETTFYDGLVFVSHQSIAPLFVDLKPMSRERILGADPDEVFAYLKDLVP
jgi:hypothetical protein